MMAMSTKETGNKTWLMVTVFTPIWMVRPSTALGKKTDEMVMGWKHGQMVHASKGTMLIAKSMAMAALNMLVGVLTLETFLKIS